MNAQPTEEPNSPADTTDGYFVIIPNWILEAASGTALKLYGILSTYLSATASTAWPSRKTLATRLGLSRAESVDKYLRELEDLGALRIEPRYRADGGQTSSGYRILRSPAAPLPRKPRTPPLKTAGGPPLKTADEVKTIFNLDKKGSLRSPKSATAAEPALLSPDLSPTVDNAAPGDIVVWDPADIDPALGHVEEIRQDPFGEFWKIYPRRDDKKRALVAFAKAAKEVGVEPILAGARRYAEDPNRDPRYTKQPATWLNAGSWDNEALPARGGSSRPTLTDKLAQTASLTGQSIPPWMSGPDTLGLNRELPAPY